MTNPPRSFFTKRRKALNPKERLQFAKSANLQLNKILPMLPKQAKIALYQDSFGELPTFGIALFCLKNGFTPHLPIVVGNKMKFAPLILKHHTQHCFYNTPQKRHKLGMNEPISRHMIHAHELDAIFCPLVALDKMGVRMGMGGGFYDRTLANFTGLKIGWCYEFQLVEELISNDWDIKMNLGITPNRILFF